MSWIPLTLTIYCHTSEPRSEIAFNAELVGINCESPIGDLECRFIVVVYRLGAKSMERSK